MRLWPVISKSEPTGATPAKAPGPSHRKGRPSSASTLSNTVCSPGRSSFRTRTRPPLLQLGERLHSQLQPVGELEGLLVERIIAAAWRLRRVLAVETGIYEEERLNSYTGEEYGLGLAFIRDANSANAFSKLSRYETTIERGLFKALHELQRLQAARRAEADVLPPPAVDVDVNVSGLSKEDL